MARYNENIAQRLCQHLAEGEAVWNACRKEKICKDTFYRWVKTKPDFAAAAAEAREKGYERVGEVANQTLLKLLTGYDVVEERTVTVNTGKKDENGKPITRVKEYVKTTKHIPPNAAVVIFTLCNRDPAHWKNRRETEVTADVGFRSRLENLSNEQLLQIINKAKDVVLDIEADGDGDAEGEEETGEGEEATSDE